MAITVKSVTTATQGDQSGTTHLSTITLTTPAASAGDLLVIIVSNDYWAMGDISLTSISPTATATEMTSFDSDGGSAKPHIKGWWAPVTTAGAVTVTADTGHDDEEKGLVVYILSGADTAFPVDDSASTGAMLTATNLSAPFVSPASADALLISHVQTNGSGQGRTYTAPAGMTNAYNATDGAFMRILGASEQLSASGPTGTRTWTGSGSAGYTAASVAIKAASVGGGIATTPAWVNRTVLSGSSISANGTTSHTCTFTAASPGNLLVAIVAGSVTSSTPTGWTLVTSSVSSSGIYVFSKIASASESSFTTTHNGSNYPIEGLVYEFPATYSIVGTAGADSISYATTDSGPVCSGISNAIYTRFAARSINMLTGARTAQAAWAVPTTEDYDAYTNGSTTSGVYLTVAYDDGCVSDSFTPYASISTTGSPATTTQTVSFAIKSDATIPIPRFEQGDTFGSSGSDTTIVAAYPRDVLAGDLLVAAFSFQSTSITATATDSQGNTYQLATGPVANGTLGFSDYIFYAVAGSTGSNTITINLSGAAAYRRLAIHEYQGVNTLDAATGAIGTTGAPDSGSVTTTQDNELIFGWAISGAGTTSAGSGFTLRETALSESTEDKVVTSIGTYNAVYPSGASAWIAQVAAFYYYIPNDVVNMSGIVAWLTV